jgi:hypothetical protein
MEPNGRQRLRMRFENAKTTRVRGVDKRLGKFDIVVCPTPEDKDNLFINTSSSPSFNNENTKYKHPDKGDYLEILWPRQERSKKGIEKLLGIKIGLGSDISGLYLGGDKYPEMCCICCKPVTRYWFYQEIKHAYNTNDIEKFELEDDFKDKWSMISKAIANDRYWYAIPFCDEHDWTDGPVVADYIGHFNVKGFVNPEYGKQFAELNGYKIHWVNAREAKLRRRASCSFVIGLVLLLIPVTIIWLEQNSGDLGPLPYFTIPGAIAVLIALFYKIASIMAGVPLHLNVV